MEYSSFDGYAEAVALDRYDVISPLVKRKLTDAERSREVVRIAASLHILKNSTGKTVSLSPKTIERWYGWYDRGRRSDRGELLHPPGFDALKPARRSDCGVARALSDDILERAERLRREEPSRTTRMLISLIRAEHELDGKTPPPIVEATLGRHLRKRYCSRVALKREGRAFPRWERPHRNSVWQADFSDGIYLPDPTQPARRRLTYIHAIIDDHTRWIVHAQFYFNENLPCLEDCFRQALISGGVPETLYWDNGKVYQSRQMKLAAARLGTQIVFATPYAPEGKGKIERWFKTLQESFYPEARRANCNTLDELNQFFWGWLTTEYHGREHTSLGPGETPKVRWEADARGVRAVDPAVLVELFLWEEPRRVDKTGCVQLRGNRYPVQEHLVGKTVDVRFTPFDLSHVRIYVDGKFLQTTEPQELQAQTYRKAEPQKPVPPSVLPSAERYRKKLSDGVQAEVDGVVARARQSGHTSEYLTRPELVALVAEALHGRAFSAKEGAAMADFFSRHAPLRRDVSRAALRRAVEEKGAERHLRFYLDAVGEARSREVQ